MDSVTRAVMKNDGDLQKQWKMIDENFVGIGRRVVGGRFRAFVGSNGGVDWIWIWIWICTYQVVS